MAIRLPFLTPPDRKRSAPTSFALLAGEQMVEVTIRRHARARRFTLRLDRTGTGAVITMPRRASLATARAFAERHAGWIAERLAARPEPAEVPETVMIRGLRHRVCPTGSPRGRIEIIPTDDGPLIRVPGEAPHVRRRLVDHLKREAKADLDAAVARHAAALGVRPSAIRLRDTRSRWGSAASSGTLSFSWRLVMAPSFVLDYVAAHEVAHLKEMNHSDRFWQLCHRLCPETEAARAYLKAEGSSLHHLP